VIQIEKFARTWAARDGEFLDHHTSGAAIRVQAVSKHYLLFERPDQRLKQMLVPRLQRLVGLPPKQYYRDFAALSGVSFEVRHGETVGIAGRNGSGKSTLLQIICGTLRPNEGSVEVNGRIAALLELGAGFNPEFTGRENVYINGAILGLTRSEVDERFDAIARFADIGAFIDQPVKTYSSGMYVRLAFSTAINVDPDILVVDEALSVGDEAFQRKCFARIEEIQQRGGTILFVSHNPQSILQLCSRALLIDGGELLLDADPKTVVSQYQRLINLSGAEGVAVRDEIRQCALRPHAGSGPRAAPLRALNGAGPELGSGMAQPGASAASLEGYDPELVPQSLVAYERHGAVIRDLRLLNTEGERVNILQMGRRYSYEYFVDFSADAADVGFGMLINTTSGFGIGGATTAYSRALRTPRVAPGTSARVRFAFDCKLLPGTYFLNAGVLGTVEGQQRYLHRVIDGLAFRVAAAEELVATTLVDLNVSPDVVVVSERPSERPGRG
jgi:ABC-type polysaccharide/polyol phosphate transport system ATPase subunit